MPLVTEWIDALREEFGAEEINAQIKRGMAGEGCFFARENGFKAGSKSRYMESGGEQ